MIFKPEMVALIFYFFWFLALTFIFIKFYSYYGKLTKNSKKETIAGVLDEIFGQEKDLNKQIDDIKKRCDNLEEESLLHIQKIGLLRFNPFKDTGGDQSFILAILDAKDTGVVVSSLHSRTGTRWYAKRIVNGKGLEYDLSSDEEKAIKEARSINGGSTKREPKNHSGASIRK